MSSPRIVQMIKEYKQTEKKLLKSQEKEDRDRKEKEEMKFMCSLWHRIFYRSEPYYVKGEQSDKFNRKIFEVPIQSLNYVNENNLGFTNQVLIQQGEKLTQIFVPTYVSLKVKSIQELNIKDLVAKIQTVIIINFYVQSLPEELLEFLRSKVMVQVNRGEGFFLIEEEGKTNIKFKEAGKNKEFFTFTIRQTFPVQIYEDIFWSPFEVLRLVFSITLNSVTINKSKKEKAESPLKGVKIQKCNTTKYEYNPARNYSISFNCMRNPEKINISYITGCRVGVYDLAENLLEGYPSNLATYDEIKDNFTKFVQSTQKKSENQDDKVLQQRESMLETNIQNNKKRSKILQPKSEEQKKGKKEDKIKYYQYSHFVIPVYKYPGNAMATIYIPVFMLSLLSISIFFQSTNTDQKIGSIATFVLGFIALIPSIKDELPPSQKITFSQIVVYIQALNCMLTLVSHWFAYSDDVWENPIFLLSLFLHVSCFLSISVLFYLHVFWWQPLYNRSNKIKQLDAVSHRYRWDNPYCDDVFLKFNSKLSRQKSNMMVFSAHSSRGIQDMIQNAEKKQKKEDKKEETTQKKQEVKEAKQSSQAKTQHKEEVSLQKQKKDSVQMKQAIYNREQTLSLESQFESQS